jgi:hypothetical protein
MGNNKIPKSWKWRETLKSERRRRSVLASKSRSRDKKMEASPMNDKINN